MLRFGADRIERVFARASNGGDAPLVAEVLTLQTVLAIITMPIAIGLVA